MPAVYEPSQNNFTVVSRWPSPPLIAGKVNRVEAVVKITRRDFPVPIGTVIEATITSVGQPDIVVALPLTLREVTYNVNRPSAGNVILKWSFKPPIPGKYVVTYRDENDIVRGIDYPTVKAA